MNPSSFSSSFFLVFFCVHVLVLHSQSATASPQVTALLSLAASLSDPLKTFREWNLTLSSDFCSWHGVVCDNPESGRIISLNLSSRNLSGTIPSEIKGLVWLMALNLSHNVFSGPLPAAVFELSSLHELDINHNSFTSSFPTGITKIQSLRYFDAYSNSFTGALPDDISQLRYLEHLNLGGSYFDGDIPASYGGLTRLQFLNLAGNLLTGEVPAQLGYLGQLERLEIGYNELTGSLPGELSSLSNLGYLDISNCSLSGKIPYQLGKLTKLQILLLFKNQFSGEIPASLENLGSLESLDLSDNNLSGAIPSKVGSFMNLTLLFLMNNNLSGEIPAGIGELPSLTALGLWNNLLEGNLPQKLGSSGKLQKVDVSSNTLTGPIPPNLCSGNQLTKLIMFNNKFSGKIPASLSRCTSLLRFRTQDNLLNGSIPTGFGGLPNLTYLDFSNNAFSGEIPTDIGSSGSLEYVNISGNAFRSRLPENIWSSPSLQIFSARAGELVGTIPNFTGCRSLYKIELQCNSLNGSIPWTIEHCKKLLSLKLNQNSISGIIPWEMSSLPAITDIDLAHNFLTGAIPSNFSNCSTIESFNVSYNQLSGPIPLLGTIFPNLHPSSFAGNDGLCGEIVNKPCSTSFSSTHDHPQSRKTAGALVWIIASALGVGLFVLVAATKCFRANCSRRELMYPNECRVGPWNLTAFQKLSFTAEDVIECVSMTDKIIGMGSTGTVYRAEMPVGEIIAVKKLWSKQKETLRRRRGVLAEVEVLGNVRHRNIVRLLGCCTNRDCTMLLYEYMPNGSLDDLLHGKNKCSNVGNGGSTAADWLTRYKIAVGVAQGISYLHHDCSPVIVHRDLKPSNILLDAEMEARVADFGVAKLIECDESMSVIAGSYGYIAPEYAYTLQVDGKSDIYSYGVVLMEILSGKRSVESEFGDGNSIVDWVRLKIKTKNGVDDVLDRDVGAACSSVREEMILLLRIALLCTSRSPADRPSMRDVVSMLKEAKPMRKTPAAGGHNDVVAGAGAGGGPAPLYRKSLTVEY